MPERARRSLQSVLMLAPEAAPWAKTGGLGDVTTALSAALARLGLQVTLVLPRYRGIGSGPAPLDRFPVTIGSRTFETGLYGLSWGGVEVCFVDSPELFGRDSLYGLGTHDYPDNPRRFGYLARAALEAQARAGRRPDVVHAHDWQGGLAAVYLRTLYRDHPVLGRSATIFTIHNLAFQGLFGSEWLRELDLDHGLFVPDALEYWGRLSFLKGGINFSDMITTVSRRYAREILTPEYGFGFEGVLARRKAALAGVLNGIDVDEWNPETDPHLPAPYSAQRLDGKRRCKAAALEAFGLPADGPALGRPLVAMIARLVDQKGLDLVAAASDGLVRLDATYAVLGTGEPRYETLWRELAAAHAGRIAARMAFDERLAHLLEAGADVFLMPSRFEPCGLNQMYSLRYGTVPVVRATGGLDDTVRDYRARTGAGNGFKFRDYTPAALLTALRRAVALYREDPAAWRTLQRAGMAADHSWDVSAREYVKVYERAIRAARRTGRKRPA